MGKMSQAQGILIQRLKRELIDSAQGINGKSQIDAEFALIQIALNPNFSKSTRKELVDLYKKVSNWNG